MMILINDKRYLPDKFYAGEFKTEPFRGHIKWVYEVDNLCEDFMLLSLINACLEDMASGAYQVECDYIPYLRSHHSNENEFNGSFVYRSLNNLHFYSKLQQHSKPSYNVQFTSNRKYDRNKRYFALDKSEYERSDNSEMTGYFSKMRIQGKISSYNLIINTDCWDFCDNIEGKDIVLVDDLIGYGTTAQKACEILFKQDVNSIAIEVDIAEDIYMQNKYFEENNVEVRYKKLIKGSTNK